MDAAAGRWRSSAVRAGLVVFVLAWIFGPEALRRAVPVWLPFLVALGLELQFFLGARREGSRPASAARRLPQDVDLERYGYRAETGELLLVRRGGEEVWVPYAGETGDELEALIEAARERPDEERAAPPRVAGQTGRGGVRQLVAGVAVLGALAALVWLSASRDGWERLGADERARATARFSTEASRLAGRPVRIRCDESGEHVGAVQHADGVAVVGGDLAYLTPQRCYDLYRLAAKGEVTFSQTGRALAVLAHETWHLRGVRDEATTECYAVQAGVELGRRLGLTEGTARRMMRQQLAENALRRGTGAEYAVSRECRDGGELDLDPRSSEFP